MYAHQETNESLLALEKSLRVTLNPVDPDQRFVRNLRNRLEKNHADPYQQQLAAKMLTIAMGLVIGLTIFLIGRRFLGRES